MFITGLTANYSVFNLIVLLS